MAALTLAPVAGAVAATSKPKPDYSRLTVKAGKSAARATLGSFCHPTGEGGGRCEEAKFPLKTTGTVRVASSGVVELVFGAKPSHVAWRAARIDGRGEEQIVATGQAALVSSKSPTRWRLRLPRKLSRSTDLLGFSVEYPYAYSSFEIGAKLRSVPQKRRR